MSFTLKLNVNFVNSKKKATFITKTFCKDQENPNFSAFGTCGSLSNDPVFDPGRLVTRSDGTNRQGET